MNKHPVTSEEEEEPELEDEDEDDVNEDESAAVDEDEPLMEVSSTTEKLLSTNSHEAEMIWNYQLPKAAHKAPPLRLSIRSSLFPNLPMSSRSRDVAPLPQADPSEASNKSSAEREGTDSEFRSSPNPNKRRKYSTEPSETSEHLVQLQDALGYFKTQPDNSSTAEMEWSSEDFAALRELFTKTRAKARSTSITLDAERANRQATYEAALGRANRRAHKAEENLREVTANYGDKIRAAQAAWSTADQETIGLRKAHTDTLEAKAAEIAALRSELQAARERSTDAALVDDVQEKLGEMQKQLAELQEKDTAKEAQLRLYDQLRDGITKEVDTLQILQGATHQSSEAFEIAFKTLSASITDLNNTIDDLPSKKIEVYVHKIQGEKEEMAKALGIARDSWTKTNEAVSAFQAQFAAGSLGGGAKEARIDNTDLNAVD